mmetsp:Transcript_78317/g.254382  ORF Transcript_78317/g.254382 Transcript_78317/m.254382 type:complete len:249 (+) Transcript_78317:1491-2237(+)
MKSIHVSKKRLVVTELSSHHHWPTGRRGESGSSFSGGKVLTYNALKDVISNWPTSGRVSVPSVEDVESVELLRAVRSRPLSLKELASSEPLEAKMGTTWTLASRIKCTTSKRPRSSEMPSFERAPGTFVMTSCRGHCSNKVLDSSARLKQSSSTSLAVIVRQSSPPRKIGTGRCVLRSGSKLWRLWSASSLPKPPAPPLAARARPPLRALRTGSCATLRSFRFIASQSSATFRSSEGVDAPPVMTSRR